MIFTLLFMYEMLELIWVLSVFFLFGLFFELLS